MDGGGEARRYLGCRRFRKEGGKKDGMDDTQQKPVAVASLVSAAFVLCVAAGAPAVPGQIYRQR